LLEDEDLYNTMKNAPNRFGDGKASERIADIIERI
jgi:UDP-N-acetylglucosamine 2-epimerase